MLDEIGDAADPAGDHRAGAAERLDEHAAHPLGARGQDEERRFVERMGDLGLAEELVPARLRGHVAQQLLDGRPQRPGADEPEARTGNLRRGDAPRVRQPVDVLVALEHADEQGLWPLRQGLRRFLQERVEVHERRELIGRLQSERADERRRVPRHGADAVGLAEPHQSDAVGDGVQRRSQPRPVQSGRRAPVAVEIGDHGGVDPSEATPGECSGSLVCALREHGVRPEVAQLAGDAHRQCREERRAVERRQRAREMKAVVVAASAREYAEVELVPEGVPLAREARRQRQADAPRDEQDARLHERAARRNVDSSSPKTRSGAYAATEGAAPARRRPRSSASAK